MRHGKGKRKMNYAQAILLALFSAVAVGCVEGLQEVYELQDTHESWECRRILRSSH